MLSRPARSRTITGGGGRERGTYMQGNKTAGETSDECGQVTDELSVALLGFCGSDNAAVQSFPFFPPTSSILAAGHASARLAKLYQDRSSSPLPDMPLAWRTPTCLVVRPHLRDMRACVNHTHHNRDLSPWRDLLCLCIVFRALSPLSLSSCLMN